MFWSNIGIKLNKDTVYIALAWYFESCVTLFQYFQYFDFLCACRYSFDEKSMDQNPNSNLNDNFVLQSHVPNIK